MNKVLLSILIGCYGAQVTAQRLPNVIYILADDIGYTDWGCYGATKISKSHNLIYTKSHG